jgi:hypothetical protein
LQPGGFQRGFALGYLNVVRRHPNARSFFNGPEHFLFGPPDERFFVHVGHQRFVTPENGETFAGGGACSGAYIKDIFRHFLLDVASQLLFINSLSSVGCKGSIQGLRLFNQADVQLRWLVHPYRRVGSRTIAQIGAKRCYPYAGPRTCRPKHHRFWKAH